MIYIRPNSLLKKKTGIMKMYGIKFFFIIFQKGFSTDFQKRGTNGKSAYYPVCMHNSLV